MREADQIPPVAKHVEAEVTHHTYPHVQLVDSTQEHRKVCEDAGHIRLDSAEVRCQRCPQHSRTARQVRSTAPANKHSVVAHLRLTVKRKRFETSRQRATPHIAGHVPCVLTQSSLVAKSTNTYLSNVEDILGMCGVDKVQMTPEDLEIDELLHAQRQQVAGGDGPSTSEGNLWLSTRNTRHTAIGNHWLHHSLRGLVTTATIASMLEGTLHPSGSPSSICGIRCSCTGSLVPCQAQVDTAHIMHTGTGRRRGEVPRETDGVTKLPMVGVVQRGEKTPTASLGIAG